MHPCLSVDELVRLITYELVASRGRATAVALACCRKSFEDPVLDTLWETQEKILPLIKSLPEDVWNPGGYNVGVPTTSVISIYPTIDFESHSEDSQQSWNGLASESTLEGYGSSNHISSWTL